MSTEDFNNHIQKRNHKDKESSLNLQSQNGRADNLVQIASSFAGNDANSVSCYQRSNIEANANITAIHNGFGCTNVSKANSVDSSSNGLNGRRPIDECIANLSYPHAENTTSQHANTVSDIKNTASEVTEAPPDAFKNLKDAIANMNYATDVPNTNDRFRTKQNHIQSNPATLPELGYAIAGVRISQAIPSIAVDLTSRMIRRPFDEIQITALLMRYLNIFDSNLKVIPFGSATYGFGGSNSNFNVLVNAGISNFCYIKLIFANRC